MKKIKYIFVIVTFLISCNTSKQVTTTNQPQQINKDNKVLVTGNVTDLSSNSHDKIN